MRRTIISTICMAVALVLAASCNKIDENAPSVESNGRTVITAVAESVGGGAKAYNQYSYDVLWNENDKIYVTNGNKANTFTVSSESAGTSKGRFTEDTPSYGITGNIEAFYPASLKTADGYVWPATQSNNQVAPMYAKQAISGTGAETVSFSSLGAMLQIVFNSTTPDITISSVTIRDVSKPLSGKFTVDGNEQAVIDDEAENVGITLDLGEGVEMGKSSKYFYIAIPAGDYYGDEITFTFTDSKSGVECVMKSTTFPDIARNTVGRITLCGIFKDKIPAGALPGKFTVDMEGKQVYFSKGNLQATYRSSTGGYSWGFAANQYDMIGDAPGNTTIGADQTDGAVVDLFGWSTVAKYYGIDISTNRDEYSGDFVDWGTAYCKDYNILPADTWRTLSTNEWTYLIQHNKHGWATVNGVGGLVIAPDGFEGSINSTYDTYHLSELNLVFLPAEGVRLGTSVSRIGTYSHYYSSTPMTGYSTFCIYFYFTPPLPQSIFTNFMEDRCDGCNVRLVTDVNYTPAEQRRYTVSFYMGSYGTAPATFMSDTGATISKPEDPTASGQEFKGWYKDFNCEYAWDFDTDKLTRDIVLFAKWAQI